MWKARSGRAPRFVSGCLERRAPTWRLKYCKAILRPCFIERTGLGCVDVATLVTNSELQRQRPSLASTLRSFAQPASLEPTASCLPRDDTET